MTPSRSSRAGIAPPGYRLPDDTVPGAVRLQVADLGRSIDFYAGLLGFELLHRSTGTARLGAGEAVWIELREKPGVRPARRALGLFHVAYLLPDRAHLGRLLRQLAQEDVRLGMSDHLVSEALYLSDPDGLGVELYADRPCTMWETHGSELRMTTEPLDARDLIAAGGEGRWEGMPLGVRVGHVHLHVGDLEEAAAFYHEGLGLDKIVWSYPGALFLSAGGYHHHLGVNTWAGNARAAEEGDARLLEWSLLVHHAEEAASNLERTGYTVERQDDGWIAADPWGTRLRIASADEEHPTPWAARS